MTINETTEHPKIRGMRKLQYLVGTNQILTKQTATVRTTTTAKIRNILRCAGSALNSMTAALRLFTVVTSSQEQKNTHTNA
jgi:archaeosine-15-forming tRNA-guanine transglycosylase